MLRDAITFPVRIGLVATRLGLRLTEQAVILGLRTTERLMKVVLPRDAGGLSPEARTLDSMELDVVVAASPAPASTRPRAGAAPTSLPEAAPAHVSAEPEFVEAFAEAGAEDGAGATVHIDEPWKGYARLSANQVIARLDEASPAELAVVQLYEGLHRRRTTVLRAAQRALERSRVASRGATS